MNHVLAEMMKRLRPLISAGDYFIVEELHILHCAGKPTLHAGLTVGYALQKRPHTAIDHVMHP